LDSAPSRKKQAPEYIPGKIVKIISLGLYQKVHLDCGFPLVGVCDESFFRRVVVDRRKRSKGLLQSYRCHGDEKERE